MLARHELGVQKGLVGFNGRGFTPSLFEAMEPCVGVRTKQRMQRPVRPCRKGWLPLQTVSIEQSPLDMWMAVEDLWLRTKRLLPLSVQEVSDCYELRFHGFKALRNQIDAHGLLAAVSNSDSYRWNLDGSHGFLVQVMDGSGDDLVLQLPSLKHIEHWECGLEIAWMLQALLARMGQGSSL